MDIHEACNTVHAWAELFSSNATGLLHPGDLREAVALVKDYLERENADGKPIAELEIADYLLTTREGVRWVMPFVMTAESMEASKRRKGQC